jgi:oligopeptide transport system ATP-binding protein
MPTMDDDLLIDVRNLKTHFFTDAGVLPSVDGISFQLRKGETLGVVGESGCGKSVMSMSVLRLIPEPPGRIVGGQILFRGKNGQVQDLVQLPIQSLRKIRGNDIAMIFQEPMTSLNPVYTIGDQVAEAVMLHQGKTEEEAWEIALETLKQVKIPAAESRMEAYPHQLSGGMKQRVMIAMALSCQPSLLIADEPTTALDVTIQAQILSLLKDLQAQTGMAILLITHDLGVVAETCDRIVVMYAGRGGGNWTYTAAF